MQADAFLFQTLVQSGRRRRRRGAHLRPHAAVADRARRRGAADPARGRRHRRRRARGRRSRPARGRCSRTSSPTSRTPPAARSRSRSATGCCSSRASTSSRSSRTTRTSSCASPASRCRRCCRSTRAASSVVYASSFSKTVCPGIRVGYLVGPEELIKRVRTLGTHTYISPNMVAQSIVAEFCESGVDRDARSRPSRRRCASGATRPAARSSSTSRRRASSCPRAATSSGSTCPRAPTWPRSPRAPPSAAWCSCKGTDFLIEGGDSSLRLAYSAVSPEQIEEAIARVGEVYRQLPSRRVNARSSRLHLAHPRDLTALFRDSLAVYWTHFWTFLAIGGRGRRAGPADRRRHRPGAADRRLRLDDQRCRRRSSRRWSASSWSRR